MLAEALKAAAQSSYGTAGPEFVWRLLADGDDKRAKPSWRLSMRSEAAMHRLARTDKFFAYVTNLGLWRRRELRGNSASLLGMKARPETPPAVVSMTGLTVEAGRRPAKLTPPSRRYGCLSSSMEIPALSRSAGH